ncbi:MAG: flagellar export chaperone FlgN [Bacillota bacterium]|nr:flagellar export chaperone FlgN [Bacillota bacterium]
MELLNNLNEQLTIIEELVDVIRQEREAVLNRHVANLQHCRQEKERLQVALSRLEHERSTACGGRTLREMAALPEAPTDELLSLRRTLRAALRELKSEHDTNMLFWKHEMAYLNCMREAMNPEKNVNHYTKNGSIAPQNDAAGLSIRA